MGFFNVAPADWFRGAGAGGPSAEDIEALLVERAEARRNRDFARADAIREDLAAQGVVIEDGPDGAAWRRA